MGKKWIIAFLIGWGFAILISPRDLVGMFKRSAA